MPQVVSANVVLCETREFIIINVMRSTLPLAFLTKMMLFFEVALVLLLVKMVQNRRFTRYCESLSEVSRSELILSVSASGAPVQSILDVMVKDGEHPCN